MYTLTEAAQRDESFEYDYQTRIGRPVNGLWGLESLGFFNDQEDIDNSPTQQFGDERLAILNIKIKTVTV